MQYINRQTTPATIIVGEGGQQNLENLEAQPKIHPTAIGLCLGTNLVFIDSNPNGWPTVHPDLTYNNSEVMQNNKGPSRS